jgi:hypothetical protein
LGFAVSFRRGANAKGGVVNSFRRNQPDLVGGRNDPYRGLKFSYLNAQTLVRSLFRSHGNANLVEHELTFRKVRVHNNRGDRTSD